MKKLLSHYYFWLFLLAVLYVILFFTLENTNTQAPKQISKTQNVTKKDTIKSVTKNNDELTLLTKEYSDALKNLIKSDGGIDEWEHYNTIVNKLKNLIKSNTTGKFNKLSKLLTSKDEEIKTLREKNKCLKDKLNKKDTEIETLREKNRDLKDKLEKFEKIHFSQWLKKVKAQTLLNKELPLNLFSSLAKYLEYLKKETFNASSPDILSLVQSIFSSYIVTKGINKNLKLFVASSISFMTTTNKFEYLNKFREFAKDPKNLKQTYCSIKKEIIHSIQKTKFTEKIKRICAFAIPFFSQTISTEQKALYEKWRELEFKTIHYRQRISVIAQKELADLEEKYNAKRNHYKMYMFVWRRLDDYGETIGKQVLSMMSLIIQDLQITLEGKKQSSALCGVNITSRPTSLPTKK